MSGRPSKSVIVLREEKKSHRTKKELEQREKAEKALLSGISLKEHSYVKKNKIAHAEFLRIHELLNNIEKNDALYENIVNRYCLIYAECFEIEKIKNHCITLMQELDNKISNNDDSDLMDVKKAYEIKANILTQVNALGRQLLNNREMLLKIDKECFFTPAAALRAVPKNVREEPDEFKDMFG